MDESQYFLQNLLQHPQHFIYILFANENDTYTHNALTQQLIIINKFNNSNKIWVTIASPSTNVSMKYTNIL